MKMSKQHIREIAWLPQLLLCIFLGWQLAMSQFAVTAAQNVQLASFNQDDEPAYSFAGDFSIVKGLRTGELNVRLKIKDGLHGYSQRELAGQAPTRIVVAESDQFKVAGPFAPDKFPEPGFDETLQGDKEEFEGSVTWTAPIELSEGVDETQLGIEVRVHGQVCSDEGCIQFSKDDASFVARLGEVKLPPEVMGQQEFRGRFGHGTISGRLLNPITDGKSPVKLELTATMEPGWHIYSFAKAKSKSKEAISQPTILFFEKATGWTASIPEPSTELISKEVAGELQRYHEGEVTWTVNLNPPEDAVPGKFTLNGKILYQLCDATACDQPTVADFQIPIEIAENGASAPVALTFLAGDTSYEDMNSRGGEFWKRQPTPEVVEAIPIASLISYLLMGLVAGLILNAMPCVLPVIGLKVMSFVAQAGENRGKVFMLNLVFSLGLISVFLILATLSAFFGYGWGDLLTKSMTGSIVITSVVFAFGLSMLGVWEIPIPGLSGHSAVGQKAGEEGLAGAFFLGILTTILATPCTGPMLIPALAVTAGQPVWVTYAIFGAIGLGMALPYLLIGVYPSLISWLPKPGAWMGTFKQITGFILMATVVFLLAGFSEKPRSEYLVAVLSLLLVISVGCWWIGKSEEFPELGQRVKAWGWALGGIAVGSLVAFTFLGPSEHKLDWKEFSKSRLGELRAENRLVFIDFTGPN